MTDQTLLALAERRGDRPSRHGRIFGEALADMADAGQTADMPDRCATCAFRRGSLPNMSAGTGLVAFHCAIGTDDSEFGCHHGLKDGEPTRKCSGYDAARQAPFAAAQACAEMVLVELLDGDGSDPEREAFDRWSGEADPDYRMDVYQLGRAYARAHAIRDAEEGR